MSNIYKLSELFYQRVFRGVLYRNKLAARNQYNSMYCLISIHTYIRESASQRGSSESDTDS